MDNTIKFAIPDSVRLAQYDAKFNIEDLTQNLSSKYKQFAVEIKKIISSTLKQNDENQIQINFRLANKILEENQSVLNKFLNDESFSPDIDALVTTACDEIVNEIRELTSVSKNELNELKNYIVDEISSASDAIRGAFNNEDKNTVQQPKVNSPVIGNDAGLQQSISFESFEGLKNFTGWLTASFITKFETSQINMFSNINTSIRRIESMFESMSWTIGEETDSQIEQTVKEVEKVERQEQRHPRYTVGNSFSLKAAAMLAQIHTTMSEQNKARNRSLNGLNKMLYGAFDIVDKIGDSIASLSVKTISKTIDTSKKLLNGIMKAAGWTISKLLHSVVFWGIVAVVAWKYWLSDNVKKTITGWVNEAKQKVGSFIKGKIKPIYDRYVKKFDDYFKERWGKPLENIKNIILGPIHKFAEFIDPLWRKVKKPFDEAIEKTSAFIGKTWDFLTKKIFPKPYEAGRNLFEQIKDMGNWIWNLMTGKLSAEDAKKDFSETVWNPLVTKTKQFMHEVVNFVRVNGNYLIDLFGIPGFKFSAPTDEYGNVSTNQKSIFESISDAIMDFGKIPEVIDFGDSETDAKITIETLTYGVGGIEGGFKFTWKYGDSIKTLEIENLSDMIIETANSITEFLEMAGSCAATFAGSMIGSWVGRIIGIATAAIVGIFTGGVGLATTGFAWDIGGAVGSIIGGMIGYYLYDSTIKAKDYFSSHKKENVAEAFGVSKESADTLNNIWNAPTQLGSMAGVDYDKKTGITSLARIDTTADKLNEEDQTTLFNIGFSQDVYDRMTGVYNLSLKNKNQMNDGEQLAYNVMKHAMTPADKTYFEHFDPTINDILNERGFGMTTFGDFGRLGDWISGEDVGNQLLRINYEKFSEQQIKELYNRITTIDGGERAAWPNAVFKRIIKDNEKAIGLNALKKAFGIGGGNKSWQTIKRIIQQLIIARMIMAYFQTFIDQTIQSSITLFPDITPGEEILQQIIQQNLIANVYSMSDSRIEWYAKAFWNNVTTLIKESDSINKLTNILLNKGKDYTAIDKDRNLMLRIGNGRDTYIKNVIETIRNYTDLIRDGILKDGENVPFDFTRDKISNILQWHPQASLILLASGEIGEAFKSLDGKPSTPPFNKEDRKKILKDIFNLTANSSIEELNKEFHDILTSLNDDFDKTVSNGNSRQQINELLTKLNDADWKEKIRNRIASGIGYKENYDTLLNKFNELEKLLLDKRVRINDENGELSITIFVEQQTPGETETEDSQKANGQNVDEKPQWW